MAPCTDIGREGVNILPKQISHYVSLSWCHRTVLKWVPIAFLQKIWGQIT